MRMQKVQGGQGSDLHNQQTGINAEVEKKIIRSKTQRHIGFAKGPPFHY
jgi:hypothetical protein